MPVFQRLQLVTFLLVCLAKRTNTRATARQLDGTNSANGTNSSSIVCPATCWGQTCDHWAETENGGWTCADSESGGCDCSGCTCPADACPATCWGQTCDHWAEAENGGWTCADSESGGCDCSGCTCPADIAPSPGPTSSLVPSTSPLPTQGCVVVWNFEELQNATARDTTCINIASDITFVNYIFISNYRTVHIKSSTNAILDGNYSTFLFWVNAWSKLTLERVTLTRGYIRTKGGAIMVMDSELVMRHCKLSNNYAREVRRSEKNSSFFPPVY